MTGRDDQDQADKLARSKYPLLVIVGPTATGKTSLSIAMAEQFNGEVVSADSRLIYKGLNIGTDKPSPTEQGRVPHHLIDICQPDQTLTLGEYQRLAYQAIDSIHNRKRLPILIGGTGQYIKAVVEGWGIPEVAPQAVLREALTNLGPTELWRWLCSLDENASNRIDRRNIRRVIRALEVTLVKGIPFSKLQKKRPPHYQIKIIGLTLNRERLYRVIDDRVEDMVRRGLLKEVQELLEAGYHEDLPAMSGLGYRQILAHLQGSLEKAEAIERIKFETHRYVRQQYTWFSKKDPSIEWFDRGNPEWRLAVQKTIEGWLKKTGVEANY